MFCEICGNQLREGAQFCPKCGTPVKVIQSSQDDADQNQYNNDSPDYPNQQTSNQSRDDQPAYQDERYETDWDDGFSDDLSASDKNPKKMKKPVKWIIIAGVSLVLVVSLVVVAISVVIPLFTTSNSVLQNQNSVWADTSVVEYYFTNNLKKEKSELNKCRYYDLRIDNFSILLVQYSRAGNNDFEYYFFPSFYGNTVDELMLIKQYSFFEKNDIPLIYDAQTISTKQQNGYVITKLQLSFSFLNKYFGVDWDSADIHIASNMNNGCVERVILGVDVHYAIWSFQYSANKQFDKVLLALTEDAELGNTELINPDVSLQDIFSKSRYYYDYNNTGDLIKAGCMEPNQRSKVGFSFEYNSNNKRISSAGIQTNNDKYVSNYTRDKNGLLNHIHIDYYSNDMTKAKNSYDYDISYNNDSIQLSKTNGENSIKDIKEESDETSLESDLEESDESSHETPAEESEDNDSAEEQDKEHENIDSEPRKIKEYTAEELLQKSISEILELMNNDITVERGGTYSTFGSDPSGTVCFYNFDVLPGFVFCPRGADAENDISVAERNIINGEYESLSFIAMVNSAKLNGDISADMSYNEISEITGSYSTSPPAGQGNITQDLTGSCDNAKYAYVTYETSDEAKNHMNQNGFDEDFLKQEDPNVRFIIAFA